MLTLRQTAAEYKTLLGYIKPNGTGVRRRSVRAAGDYYTNTVNLATLPGSVNWTNEGWVGPVQNQVRARGEKTKPKMYSPYLVCLERSQCKINTTT